MENDQIFQMIFQEDLSKKKRQQIYQMFEKDLLEKLPADQPEFIAELVKENIINEDTEKKINMYEQTKIVCAVPIVEEIEESLSTSDRKLRKLAALMKKYSDGVDTLAEKIENHFDPVGTPFVCETMAQHLGRNSSELSKLPYKEMRTYLVAYGVIKHHEKVGIDHFSHRDENQREQGRMAKVLDIIQDNLHLKQTRPFKRFLELMEQSSNQRLQEAAESLGGSERVPNLTTDLEPTITQIVLIPVGQQEKIECNGKSGGIFQWKGHDFSITLPPDCANGKVNIFLDAYLPSSMGAHCLVSPVFVVNPNVKFKKPITISFPHWINVKSEKDKESLNFLVFRNNNNNLGEIKQGSFEIGESFGSTKISEFCLISITKDFATSSLCSMKAQCCLLDNSRDKGSFQIHIVTRILLNTEQRLTTEASSEITEKNYVDILVLPECHHDERWRIYCIAIDNPTYLQSVMEHFKNENWIKSSTIQDQIFKRKVAFTRPTDDATAELCMVDEQADEKIIKVLHDRKISKQKIDCMDLRISKNITCFGYKMNITESYKVNFPMSFLYIIEKSPRSLCKMRVDGLRGVAQESSEFSLLSPAEHDYKFEKYEHIEPNITKTEIFDCLGMAEHLNKELIKLTSLSYNNMKINLQAKCVITNNEKQQIDNMGSPADQMEKVINIVRVSLLVNHTVKFKGFLESMENSDDLTLKEIARQLVCIVGETAKTGRIKAK